MVFGAAEIKLIGLIYLSDLKMTFSYLDEATTLDLGGLEVVLGADADRKLIDQPFICNHLLKKLTLPKITCDRDVNYVELLYDLRNVTDLDMTNIKLNLTHDNFGVIAMTPRSLLNLKAPNITITEYIPELVYSITHNHLLHSLEIGFSTVELILQYEKGLGCEYDRSRRMFKFNDLSCISKHWGEISNVNI